MAELVNISHPAAIDRALREIRSGQVIAIPLESGYVFASDAFNAMAVAALHLLRNDPPGQAASVLIGEKVRIVGITRDLSSAAKTLIEKFWPGMLTLYLHPHPALTWDLGDEGLLDQVAVRVPASEFATLLLNETGPLAVAGAGLSGRKPLTQPELINEVFGSSIDVIFDGGTLESQVSSAVVDCTTNPPQLVRPGSIAISVLREACPEITAEVG